MMEPTQNNLTSVLKNHPLRSCEISCWLNDTGDVTEILYIYPHKKGRRTFADWLQEQHEKSEAKNGQAHTKESAPESRNLS